MITRNLLTRSYKLLLTLLVLLMSTNAFAQRLTATGKVVDTAGLESSAHLYWKREQQMVQLPILTVSFLSQ